MPEYSLTRRRELLALGVTEALPDHALAMQPESRDQRSRRTDSGRQEAWHHATARVEQPQVSRFARVRAPIRPNSNCHGQPVPAAPPVWTSMPSYVKVTVPSCEAAHVVASRLNQQAAWDTRWRRRLHFTATAQWQDRTDI